jgi:quinohemoprotein ethanol dehydrogenase
LSFALDGAAKLPPTPAPQFQTAVLDDPEMQLDAAEVQRGAVFYHLTCTACHGMEAIATGGAPDLRASGIAFNEKTLRCLLREGPLVDRGMPRFPNLSDAQIRDIYAYIRSRAREAASRGARTTSGEGNP